MANLYIYVVDRDLGFAPNPFHGTCTLATCKPDLRSGAQVGDWVMGVGGSTLRATGQCIYLMKITEVLSFDQYWRDERFQRKKPLRNGTLVMMVGDNIYHRDDGGSWIQEDSHHSNPDGSANQENMATDTSSERVLLSNHFYYFGSAAPAVDLLSIQYKNHRGHSKKSVSDDVIKFIQDFELKHRADLNTIVADPFNFQLARKRVIQATGRIYE